MLGSNARTDALRAQGSILFRLAYNTNGLAHHRLLEALDLLADLGYEGVSITPDVGELDLYRPNRALVAEIRARAVDRRLVLTIETGARFVLDPRRKHSPTLLDPDPAQRARRVDMLRRSIDLALDLGAGLVSVWSGAAPRGADGREVHGDDRDVPADPGHATPGHAPDPLLRSSDRPSPERALGHSEKRPAVELEPSESPEMSWTHLCEGLGAVLDHATASGIQIAFEPEPGMFIERPSGYVELTRRLGSRGRHLGLCLDVGHLLVSGDLPVEAVVREHASRIVHVHLDDIRAGIHEHLMFGLGDLDLRAVLRSLVAAGYAGLAAVELSRDSHRGAQAAEEALGHLRRALLDTT